jgi:bacillithiol biosynthesis deacetylase BshB1
MEPLDLLAIGAHPDDAEMTSGGWLALASRQGYRSGILHLTRGEMGTRGTPQEREAEAREAARILGLACVEFAGLTDGRLNDGEEQTALLVAWIRKLKPRFVIAPFTQCHHPDHEAAARLAIKAVHFAGLRGYRTNLEPHRVKRLCHARYSHAFEPSFYVDCSAVVDAKRAAIMAYKSQFTPATAENGEPLTMIASSTFVDQFMGIGDSFGMKAGGTHAEAYWMRVAPAFKDPVAILAQGPSHHLIR